MRTDQVLGVKHVYWQLWQLLSSACHRCGRLSHAITFHLTYRSGAENFAAVLRGRSPYPLGYSPDLFLSFCSHFCVSSLLFVSLWVISPPKKCENILNDSLKSNCSCSGKCRLIDFSSLFPRNQVPMEFRTLIMALLLVLCMQTHQDKEMLNLGQDAANIVKTDGG